MAVNVKVTGDNSGLKTAINESKAAMKDLVSDFTRKAAELDALGSKAGEAQRKLVLTTSSTGFMRGIENTFTKLNSQINVANGLYQLNGERMAMVQAKTQAYTTALSDLYAKGLKPGSAEAKVLEDEIRKLNAELFNLQGPQRAAEEQKKLADAEAKAAAAAKKAAEERKKAYGDLVNITKSAGQNLTAAVTLPIAAITTASLKAYGDLDALRRGLAVTEGSMERAMSRQKELKQIYALPGLGISEALRGDVLLREAGGFNAGESMNIMKQFGNAIALGGGGKEQFGLVVTQLTQMASKSRVLSEDLKPIINQAPVAAKAIRNMFGTVDSEEISNKLKKQGKGPKEFIQMLTAELAKADRVTGGFRNGVENLQDSMTVAGDTVGRVIDRNQILTKTLSGAGDKVEELAKWFENLSEEEQTAILTMVGFAAAAGPAIYIAGSLAGSIQNLANAKKVLTTVLGAQRTAMIASLGPYAAIAAAAALAAAGMYALYKVYNPTIVAASKLSDISKQVTTNTAGELSKVKELVAVAGDEKKSKEERAKAMQALKSQYPDYFSKMDTEKIKAGELKTAYDKLSDSIIKTARSRAAESKIQENEAKALELEMQKEELKAKLSSDKNTSAYLDRGNGRGYTMGGILYQYQDAASQSNQQQEIRNLDTQIAQYRKANEALSRFVETKKEDQKVSSSSKGDDKAGKQRADDTARALKLLADLRDVQSQTSSDRLTLNNIESDGFQQLVMISKMNISLELQYQLLLASRGATERKLFDARRKMQLQELRGVYERVIPWNPQARLQDRVRGIGKEMADNRPAAPYSGLSGFSEMEKAIARANAIDLSKPLSTWNQQLMDAMIAMNQTLSQGATDAFLGMGEVIGGLIAGTAGIEDLPKMLMGVIGGMFQQMGQAYVAYGLTTSSLIPTLTNPFTAGFGALAIGVALTALGAGLKAAISGGGKTQKFASGGIAYGRVFGLNAEAGEYSNAKTNPEIIAPLKNLTAIMQPYFLAAVKVGAAAQGQPAGRLIRVESPLYIDGRQIARSVREFDEREGRWTR